MLNKSPEDLEFNLWDLHASSSNVCWIIIAGQINTVHL